MAKNYTVVIGKARFRNTLDDDTWEDLLDGDDKEGAHGAGKGVVEAPQAVRQEGLLEAAEEDGQSGLETRARRIVTKCMHETGIGLSRNENIALYEFVLKELQEAYLDAYLDGLLGESLPFGADNSPVIAKVRDDWSRGPLS